MYPENRPKGRKYDPSHATQLQQRSLGALMTFQKGVSGKSAGRPVGVRDRRTALREALECRGEELLSKAVERALGGDTAILLALMSKLVPKLKPESSFITNSVEVGSLTERAEQLVSKALSGAISPTVAAELLQALACTARVRDSDELMERVRRLEGQLGANN